MKLLSVTLQNFRGYRDPVTIPLDDFTAFVGRNDVGKSTILEALDIFFEGGTVSLEKADLCKHADGSNIRIGCTFEVTNAEVVVDDSARTTLADEYLLNADGHLEIIKVWECAGAKPATTVLVRARHPTAEGCGKLLAAKNAELKKLVQARKLDCDLTSNPAMRRALWDSVDDLKLGPCELPIDDGAKSVWDRIRAHLPHFALFRADRPSTVNDDEVQTPMKLAVKRAISDVGPEMQAITQRVIDRALEIADATVAKLRAAFPDVADGLRPHLTKTPDPARLFEVALEDERGIPVDKRGSGVRRLILLSFFLAEVDRRRAEQQAGVAQRGMLYAVEEPETGQHPANQLLILHALRALAAAGDQVLITTHNPVLAAQLPTRALRFVTRDAARRPTVQAGGGDVLAAIATELGVLPEPLQRPVHGVRVALVVEGPTDEDALLAFSRTLFEAGRLPFALDLVRDLVFTVIGGGSNLQHWVNRRQLDKLALPQVHLYDSDREFADGPVKESTRERVASLTGRPGVHVFVTRRRCIDSYLHLGRVAELTGEAVDCQGQDPAFVRMDRVFAAQIMPAMSRRTGQMRRPHVALNDPDGKPIKLASDKAKYWISGHLMPLMTADEVLEVSAYQDGPTEPPRHEVLEWLEAVGQYLPVAAPAAATPGVPSTAMLLGDASPGTVAAPRPPAS